MRQLGRRVVAAATAPASATHRTVSKWTRPLLGGLGLRRCTMVCTMPRPLAAAGRTLLRTRSWDGLACASATTASTVSQTAAAARSGAASTTFMQVGGRGLQCRGHRARQGRRPRAWPPSERGPSAMRTLPRLMGAG
jgi:hypothetical protein